MAPQPPTSPRPSSAPGPAWLWLSAWSLQGLGVFFVGAVGVEGRLAEFLLTGLVAAAPLVGLFLLLRSGAVKG